MGRYISTFCRTNKLSTAPAALAGFVRHPRAASHLQWRSLSGRTTRAAPPPSPWVGAFSSARRARTPATARRWRGTRAASWGQPSPHCAAAPLCVCARHQPGVASGARAERLRETGPPRRRCVHTPTSSAEPGSAVWMRVLVPERTPQSPPLTTAAALKKVLPGTSRSSVAPAPSPSSPPSPPVIEERWVKGVCGSCGLLHSRSTITA
jgi:hypothetical protein